MTDRPIFGRINQNSADKVHKPTIQKSKIIKKWFFQKIDAKGVSWWILAQERPTTPKVLIFDPAEDITEIIYTTDKKTQNRLYKDFCAFWRKNNHTLKYKSKPKNIFDFTDAM